MKPGVIYEYELTMSSLNLMVLEFMCKLLTMPWEYVVSIVVETSECIRTFNIATFYIKIWNTHRHITVCFTCTIKNNWLKNLFQIGKYQSVINSKSIHHSGRGKGNLCRLLQLLRVYQKLNSCREYFTWSYENTNLKTFMQYWCAQILKMAIIVKKNRIIKNLFSYCGTT